MENLKHDLIFLAAVLTVLALLVLVGWGADSAHDVGPTHRSAIHTMTRDCVIVQDDIGEYAKCSDGVAYAVSRE